MVSKEQTNLSRVEMKVGPDVYMRLSSTYRVRSAALKSRLSWRRGEVVIAERIGERGDP